MRSLGWSLGILLTLAGGSPVAQEATPPASGAPATAEEAGKEVVRLLGQGKHAEVVARFDATMKGALPEAKLKATWELVQEKSGAFQEIEGARIEKVQVYDVVFVTTRFGKERLDVKVVLNDKREVAGLFFAPVKPAAQSTPPPYAAPDRFREIEMAVGASGWPLEGTLTLPRAEGSHPALVLVHGSGPHDRDESIGPNKPFRDLAWGLASRGVAVLRYEKRTFVHRSRLATEGSGMTVKEETIDDVVAAVQALRRRPEIDPGRVYVAGHSLGGMLVPRIAAAERSIAGFVVMAGPGRSLPEMILVQSKYLAELDGEVSEAEAARLAALHAAMARVGALMEGGTDLSGQEPILGAPASYWKDLHGYRPHEEARGVERPMLVLLGERDYQVTREDFELWESALGSRSDVRFRLFPGLNHLFIRGEGPSSPAEYESPGHVAPEVIEGIAAWVLETPAA